MIGRIRGEVIEREVGRVVVDVHGVGYVVHVGALLSVAPGEAVDLHVHTAVRDDAITLFGFATREEKAIFDLLLGVPGVGPSNAMGILQTPLSSFVELVPRREPGQLAKLPGVGKKTAERILVDLGDKIAALGSSRAPPAAARSRGTPVAPGVVGDLVSALVNLGFKNDLAEELARSAVEVHGEEAALDVLLREALARRPQAG